MVSRMSLNVTTSVGSFEYNSWFDNLRLGSAAGQDWKIERGKVYIAAHKSPINYIMRKDGLLGNEHDLGLKLEKVQIVFIAFTRVEIFTQTIWYFINHRHFDVRE